MQITQRLRTIYQKGVFSALNVPLVLLGVCVLAFGLLIPWLGFYHDDWNFVYYDAIRGTQGMLALFNFDGHPLSAFIYILSFKLVGFNPMAWHIYALVWRWLAVTMFWLLLDKMWPNHKHFSFAATLLFAIYPLFVLQILPISYFDVWISFFLFFLSLYWTVRAIQQPAKFWLFTSLAIAAKIGQMFTSEYTWGMEIMRLLIIWFMLPEKESIPKKIARTLKIFLPYLVIFLGFAVWRSLLYQSGRKEIAVQASLLPQLVSTLRNWLHYSLPDSAFILITSWFQVLNPGYLELDNRLNVSLLVLILLSAAGIAFILNRLPTTASENQNNKNPGWPAIFIGLSGLIFGLIPTYAIGYSVYSSAPPGSTRFALGAIPGAALFIMGLLQFMFDSQKARNFLVAILVGLSIGWHFRYSTEFCYLWQNQVNFYRQLSWRAPGLKPGTAVIAMDNVFPVIKYQAAILAISGDYPTALALNAIYATGPGTSQVPYWFFMDGTELLINPAPDGILSGRHVDSVFSGQSKQALRVMYTPNSTKCLHILRPSDAAYRDYPDELRLAAKSASLDAILTDARPNFALLDTISGPENSNNWCYYYQKADLAAQKEDWQAVALLWSQARQKKLAPTDGLELLPFTEAFLRRREWNSAFNLTRLANKLTRNAADVYCPLWNSLGSEQPGLAGLKQAVVKARNVLACSQRRHRQPN